MKSPQMIESGRSLPASVVMINRIIWFGLFGGQISFAIVIIVLMQQGSLHPASLPVNLMVLIDAIMLISAAVFGWVLSRWLMSPATDDQTLSRRYKTANILVMALLEAPSFFGLIIVMISGSWWPGGVVPAICIVLQLFWFPRSNV